jgi:hypothetical protein
LFKDDLLPEAFANPAAKEVLRYRQALSLGYRLVRDTGLITANHLIEIQAELERNNAGFRKLPGTALKSSSGDTVYTPPQDPAEIVALMSDLERCINDAGLFAVDSLIKMAILFVNGLPLVLLELKNPADEKADIWKAYDQIQTYKEQIPDVFQYNELLVISDGSEARLGSLSSQHRALHAVADD